MLRPVPDGTRGEPCGPRPPRRGCRRVQWPQPRSPGLRARRRQSSLCPRPRPAHRLPPPQPPPARTPARQRHPVASRNLTPSSASCAPPRPAANFLSPTSERAGRPDGRAKREGSPRRAAGPPQLLAGLPGDPPGGARSADAPARARPGTRSSVPPEGPRLPPGRAGRRCRGRGRRGDVSLAARPARRPDGPARAPPPPPPLQGPAKFLTCSGRRERESERARAAAAAAEPRERSRPSLHREAAPEQLHTPRPRRRPPRPPSAPAARWLRARVWSRGTFCLGAGERPPPPGSPPPAFPTRTSHSSSCLSPLVPWPPFCRLLANQIAEGSAAAATIGQKGGSTSQPMRERRSCGEPRGAGPKRGGAAQRNSQLCAGAGL